MIEPTAPAPEARSLADILEELRIARITLAAANSVVTSAMLARDEHTRRELDLKDELFDAMQSQGIRTGEGSGLQAQLKSRKSTVVTDVATLTASLQEEGRLDDFLVLDKSSAAKEAVKHGWDGAEVTTTTYLAVKEVAS